MWPHPSCNTYCLHADTMPKGVFIAESTCWTVVRMLICQFFPEEIRLLTDVIPCQQHRILKCLCDTDSVFPVKNDPKLRGRPCQMMAEDVAVSSLNSKLPNLIDFTI